MFVTAVKKNKPDQRCGGEHMNKTDVSMDSDIVPFQLLIAGHLIVS